MKRSAAKTRRTARRARILLPDRPHKVPARVSGGINSAPDPVQPLFAEGIGHALWLASPPNVSWSAMSTAGVEMDALGLS
jgi:hypothetical protein